MNNIIDIAVSEKPRVSLKDIGYHTNGIILVYEDQDCVGFISYNNEDEYWYFSNTIDIISANSYSETLNELISDLSPGFTYKLLTFKQ